MQKIHKLIRFLQLAYMDGRIISPTVYVNSGRKTLQCAWWKERYEFATTQTGVECVTVLCEWLYCHLSYCRLCKLIDRLLGSWLRLEHPTVAYYRVNCTVANDKYERINKYSFFRQPLIPARMRGTIVLFFPYCFTSHITAKYSCMGILDQWVFLKVDFRDSLAFKRVNWPLQIRNSDSVQTEPNGP